MRLKLNLKDPHKENNVKSGFFMVQVEIFAVFNLNDELQPFQVVHQALAPPYFNMKPRK